MSAPIPTGVTLVFNEVDQGNSDLNNALATFVTYAVGFLARPLLLELAAERQAAVG